MAIIQKSTNNNAGEGEVTAGFILVFSEILCSCTQQLFIEHLPCVAGTVSGIEEAKTNKHSP